MNLSGFLREVDACSEQMTRAELTGFIHEIARTLPEEKRPEFLQRLQGAQGESPAVMEDGAGLSERFAHVRGMLERMEAGEFCLRGSLNEEYNEWYDRDEDKFLYEDPDGVGDLIREAGEFVHICVDQESYGYGYEIARRLLGLSVMTGGEIAAHRDEPMTVAELIRHQLCALDYRRMVMDGIYAAYCANEPKLRARVVYEMIAASARDDITIGEVMRYGEGLPEGDAFLAGWVACLGDISSHLADRLLKEAMELADDPEFMLETARKYYAKHPALYRQYLLAGAHDKENRELLAIGKEALAAIDSKYVIRSQIALHMGHIALAEGQPEEAERCWVEALRSDTNIVNLLRLFTECRSFDSVRQEVEGICRLMYRQAERRQRDTDADGERKENIVSVDTAYMLAFLNGEFSHVREQAMQKKKMLGWSGSFMKCGLAAFLLLLVEGDGSGQGCREMYKRIVTAVGFEKKEYEKGLNRTIEGTDQDWFWECFRRWKKQVVLTDGEKKEYLQWIEGLLAKRIAGIMEINNRIKYSECAAMVAAVGEVKASWGDREEKQGIMLSYKQAYPHQRAFHEELRSFGMRDR